MHVCGCTPVYDFVYCIRFSSYTILRSPHPFSPFANVNMALESEVLEVCGKPALMSTFEGFPASPGSRRKRTFREVGNRKSGQTGLPELRKNFWGRDAAVQPSKSGADVTKLFLPLLIKISCNLDHCPWSSLVSKWEWGQTHCGGTPQCLSLRVSS